MSSTVRWAGIALMALVALAPPARAADSTATAPPRITTGSLPGRAGLTGLLGGSWFYAAGDFGRGALPRFDLSGAWRYQMTPGLRLQISPGFTWNAYTKHAFPPFVDPNYPNDLTKQHYLVQLTPVSAQLQWTFRGRNSLQHFGVGPGLYRVLVQHHRRDLQDPTTYKIHRGVYLGATAELGMERFFKTLPNTAFELNVATHLIDAKRDEQFPNGWNGWIGDFAIRAGTSYYFDVGRLTKKEEPPLPKSAGKKAGK